MRITHLGHAGFVVDTPHCVLVVDPWFSQRGAFDGAWMQFPRNHHLAAGVRTALESETRERVLYVSHEHKDHFDPDFLATVDLSEVSVVIPRFRRAALADQLRALAPRRVEEIEDGGSIVVGDLELTVLVDDSEMDRDSAILIDDGRHRFLDLNDCRLNDRLPEVKAAVGEVDVFACQFSGATWHPTCYEYPPERRAELSVAKRNGKFEAVARAIEVLEPRVYLPSAGPACFLDPDLVHLNFERDSVFARNGDVIAYLEKRLAFGARPLMPDLMPGDVLDVDTSTFTELGEERVAEEDVRSYIDQYALAWSPPEASMTPLSDADCVDLVDRLAIELQAKMDNFPLGDRISIPLYMGVTATQTQWLRIDFQHRTVARAEGIREDSFYALRAPAWQFRRVLDRAMTWEEFALSFRMTLLRVPDVYQPLLHAFLLGEAADLAHYCGAVLAMEADAARITVTAGGCRYEVDRTCPHLGADLSAGWIDEDRFLVCPRHRWRFDLASGGVCETSEDSINATLLGDN